MNKMHNKKALSVLKGVAVALFWLAVWWVLALAVNKQLLLPSPLEVGERFCALIVQGEFWVITVSSLLRVLAGFALGMVVGLAMAILMHKSKIIFALFSPFIKAVRATPVASFIILALVWIRTNTLPAFIAFLMVFPVLYTNLLQGIRAADRNLLEMADVFRLSPSRRVRCIFLPALRGPLFAACRVALGLCWKAGVAAEVIGVVARSVGGKLYDAKAYLEIADLFAWTVVIVAVSALFERVFLFLLGKIFDALEHAV